ncbi:hypothetical protein HJC99_00090 [Candidatus Saccharibacteria bacterium]|nr:hypothetical protein [Candidatus Saccharibacteria bacterium]
MSFIKDFGDILKLVKAGENSYSAAMQYIERKKAQLKLIITITVIWALVMLGLVIYIAFKVS